jgi:hypothetical protein
MPGKVVTSPTLMVVSVERVVSVKEETGQGSPSLIQGGFERSFWQQNPARCCAARERFTLRVDCRSRAAT